MEYTLRQAIVEDLEILDRIHTENMKGYVEKVYLWQDRLFRDCFVAQEYQVIEVQQEIAGFVKIVTSATDIYLAEIQIFQKYQNQGIGTNFIQLVIDLAKKSDRLLWLKVIKGNPAIQLYQKLGFEIFESTPTHIKMRITQSDGFSLTRLFMP